MSEIAMDEVRPGCQPFAARGSGGNEAVGVVFVHGFTGSPDSTVPWATYLNERGFTVNAIRLPGHGTTWQDANTKSAAQLQAAVDDAVAQMCQECESVFVMASSFGGTLALRVAAERPDTVRGLVLVNPWVRADGTAGWQRHLAPLQRVLPRLTKSIPGVMGDIADPAKEELGYERVPVHLLADVATQSFGELRPLLGNVTTPLQLVISATDHVLAPNNAELIRAHVRSPIDEVTLHRSYHVATLDYDAELIFAGSVDFIERHR